MPPPVSSAVILTKTAEGNEAAAVFNSALGSVLGVFITPFLLVNVAGLAETRIPARKIILQLCLTVLLPLICGQVAQNLIRPHKWAKLSGILSQSMLLLIVFTTFCDAFASDHGFGIVNVLQVAFGVFIAQLILSAALFKASTGPFGFEPWDAVATTFCSYHKSLTLGIPILRILYEGSPDLAALSLPLLIYHPMQIALGGAIIAPYLRTYVRKRRRSKNTVDFA